MKAFCKHYEKEKVLTKAESLVIQNTYKNGFHVYFQPIVGEEKEPLFRTAEYIASGFFHNSQIQKIDDGSAYPLTGLPTVTFRYKSWVEKDTREKSFQEQTIDVYEFMARMLFFLPEPNRKMIRYYGIYANRIMVRHIMLRPLGSDIEFGLDAAAWLVSLSNPHQPDNSVLSQRTWAQAIENSFDAKPQSCPDCTKRMQLTVVYSYSARKTMEGLKETHTYLNGYFRPKPKIP